MASFYEQRMLRLFERYELPNNARVMFKALEEFETSIIDEAALGRLVRLSPTNRSALVSTMVKCANIMKEKPKESKYCLTIITSCGKMLEIANKPTQNVGFPGFGKLPPEIRHRIYDMYLGNGAGAPVIIPNPKKDNCSCAPHEPPAHEKFVNVDMALAFTSKRISAECLGSFYSKRRVMFHWCGARADIGISQLKGMEQLEVMTVVVSRATSRLLTHREQEIREFFGAKRNSYNTLPESLGWDELISLRGLKIVTVEHINKRKADRRTDEDRKSLENMLNRYLLRPNDSSQ
ncbi:hypothetical protein ONZ43_g5894 [Nemania bipapillata]|uniref:Uncharacterized protein n=1 Tax=Nemania bipapillata TaxID=110536 RepID=A0ACC2I5U4_9PEZI|nr:hypothetical protein ONZ43_g5894 [Nemania bipapillata]